MDKLESSDPWWIGPLLKQVPFGPNLNSLYSIHSYGRMWLHPFGHYDENEDCVKSPDHNDQVSI